MTTQQEERTIGMILEKLENIENNFVTKQEFFPVKILVFGFVGIVMIAVVTTMVYGVITNTTAKANGSSVIASE